MISYYFVIQYIFTYTYLYIGMLLMNETSNSTQNIDIYAYNFDWTCNQIYSKAYSSQIEVYLISSIYHYYNYNYQIFSFTDFQAQVSTAKFNIGSSSNKTFTGFMYNLNIFNYYKSSLNIEYPYSTYSCGINKTSNNNYYYCMDCDLIYSAWNLNTGELCGSCYSQNCSACYGSLKKYCTQCNNGKAPPNCDLGLKCLSGSDFECESCVDGYQLIKGICTRPPYKYNASNLNTPVIDIKFDEFKQFYSDILEVDIIMKLMHLSITLKSMILSQLKTEGCISNIILF